MQICTPITCLTFFFFGLTSTSLDWFISGEYPPFCERATQLGTSVMTILFTLYERCGGSSLSRHELIIFYNGI